MKKLFLIAFTFAAVSVMAQQAVPNGGFETWTNTSISSPKYYPINSNRETFAMKLPLNCVKITDSYHGSSAVKLTTVANVTDTMFAYMVNAQPKGDPTEWHGGIPYAQMPTGVRGYYKSDIKPGDTALIIVAFSKAGVNIGSFFLPITGQKTTYTLFLLPVSLTQTPDSMIFGATSSNAITEHAISGSMLQLDSVSFTGVASQPAQLNGDFEDWDIATVEIPNGWYTDSRDLVSVKSNAAYRGLAAVVLQTTMGDKDGKARANAGVLGTGYYPQNCQNCIEAGGYPFTGQTDTLIFWYKYTSVGGARGEAWVKLKKNGVFITQNNVTLNTANSFQYIELPFYASLLPDTLMVGFRSSRWDDTLTTTIGSTLIVDEAQLKSQRLHTGLSRLDAMSKLPVFPNPAHDVLYVPGTFNNLKDNFVVFDMLGARLLTSPLEGTQPAVDIRTLPAGMYFIYIMHDGCAVQRERLLVK